MQFQLSSEYQPQGHQPAAIDQLVAGLQQGLANQVLLGVTGSGKTFTMAQTIARVQKPTLVISHNKTLAAQLYQEFHSFFPKNAVSYFVSYYDYYQPEAYIPQTDTYIDKETEINEEIDKLRLATTTNLLTRSDTLVVASVSCIYNIGSPKAYAQWVLELRAGMPVARKSIFARLVHLQYTRSQYGFHRGTFRVRGEHVDIFPAYADSAVRLHHDGEKITAILLIDPVSGKTIEDRRHLTIYPAKHYITDPQSKPDVFGQIRDDLDEQGARFEQMGKMVEAQRLRQRVTYDLEMIETMGYVNGIENYSRYFDGRRPGEAPFTLFEYFAERFGDDWLLFIDESHMTVPQIRGMYAGDRSRKETLIEYGFRLPAAFDNRPLRFDEVLSRMPHTIYVSATPKQWEVDRAKKDARNWRTQAQTSKRLHSGVVEQLVRPTGLVDPEVVVRPIRNQIPDLIEEIMARIAQSERVLVTTLTKKTAEDLAGFLQEQHIKVHYLHSDVQTLERSEILTDLRRGAYDVIVGINLLREGLDLPEVSLVAILEADKEGFLRSDIALIQTMGRAARHVRGQVILYADTVTDSMRRAMEEVQRRREIQLTFNAKHRITPVSISKPIRDRLIEYEEGSRKHARALDKQAVALESLTGDALESLTPLDRKKMLKKLRRQMNSAAKALDFEYAAAVRDKIHQIQAQSNSA